MLNLLQRVLANRVLRNKFQTYGRLFIAILLSMSWIGCSSSTAPPQETTSSETAKHEASPVEQQDHQSPQSSPESTSNLNIGDTAPLLQIANWIKGTPVESYEENKIYVVEFRNLVYNGTLLFLDQLLLMVRLVPLVTEILN